MNRLENEMDIINPALMLAISRMRENNNLVTQNKMIAEALNARFLVPCVIQVRPGTEQEAKRNADNTMVHFNMLQTKEKEKFFIAFTDIGELKKWQDDDKQNGMVMGFDDLADLIRSAGDQACGFVLNPVTTNVMFRKEIMMDILAKRDKAVAEGKLKKVSAEEVKELKKEKADKGMGEA